MQHVSRTAVPEQDANHDDSDSSTPSSEFVESEPEVLSESESESDSGPASIDYNLRSQERGYDERYDEDYDEDCDEDYDEDDYDDDDEDEESRVAKDVLVKEQVPRAPVVPLPARLIPPLELQLKILSHNNDYVWAWTEGRLVSKAWKDEIEKIAKEDWMRKASLDYDGGLFHTELATWGKVFLFGTLSFIGFQDDLAIFKEHLSDKRFHKLTLGAAYSTPFDARLGPILHDIKLQNMVRDNHKVRVTIPWYSFIGQLVAEEKRVKVLQDKVPSWNDRIRAGKEKSDPGQDHGMMIFNAYVSSKRDLDACYSAVRSKRRGRSDKNGDEKLQLTRNGYEDPDVVAARRERKRQRRDKRAKAATSP